MTGYFFGLQIIKCTLTNTKASFIFSYLQTEQIRRSNRLFASDSLFLRQFLMVPVDKSSPYYPNVGASCSNNDVSMLESVMENCSGGDPLNCISSSTLSSSSASSSSMSTDSSNPRPATLPTRPYSIAGELLVQAGDEDATLGMSNNGNSKQSKSLDSVAAMSPEEESRRSINEFLSKIDNTISESRKYVEKSKE